MNFLRYITSTKNLLIIIKSIPPLADEIIIRIISMQLFSDLLQSSLKMISRYTKIPLIQV